MTNAYEPAAERAEAPATAAVPGRWRQRLQLHVIAVEVFSIVLGVFLALGVNQWRERQSQRERAEVALANIEQEMRANLAFLEIIHDGNVAVLDALDAEDARLDTAQVSFVPGLQLRHTAWQTAEAVGVFAHTDYGRIVDLAELYEMQTVYRTLAYQLTQAMMNGIAFAAAQGTPWDNEEANPQFAPFFRLIVQAEGALMDQYRERLAAGGPAEAATVDAR